IHPHDTKRVLRALEIIAQTGSSVTDLRSRQTKKPWIGQTVFIGLMRDRKDLNERIIRRTHWMYQNGLIEETRYLLDMGCTSEHTAFQALGYKECELYLKR